MKVFVIFFLSIVCLMAHAQTNSSEISQFRRDYDYISIYNVKTQTWGDWEKGTNTFVFNINDNGDFRLFMASGKREVFRKVSDVREERTNKGDKYQIVICLDEKGNECSLQLFNFGDAKLIFQDGAMIQFTNSEMN